MKGKIRIVNESGLGVGVKVYDCDGHRIMAAWSKAVITIEAGEITRAVITYEGVDVDAVADAS